MPIPQQITSDMKLIISYKIKMKEAEAYQVVSDLEIPFLDFKISETENTKSWVRSHRYIYNITFGALTKIKFHPSVTDWTEVTNAGTFVIK